MITIIKKLKKISILIISILCLSGIAFFIYSANYYKTQDLVQTEFQKALEDEEIRIEDNFIVIPAKIKTDTALIFYPGGKVEASAYYPLMSKILEKGITCIIVKMPLHLAIFDVSAADRAYEKFPEIKNWYIGGHSLGGAMASTYMEKNTDKLNGMILLGAYIYGDVSPSKVLTIYGSKDEVLNRQKIDYDENVLVIDGGNHANFGNYGQQKGDGEATIGKEEQQQQTADAIYSFIEKLNELH